MYLPNNGFVKGPLLSDTSRRVEDIYFCDSNVGYAVTITNRILKTVNGGITWKIKNDTTTTLQLPSFRSIEFLDDGKYGVAGCLGAYAKIFRTIDSGETWNDITSSVSDPSPNFKHNICGLAHYGNNFYGVGYWSSDTGRLYKSADKGATWQFSYLDTSLIRNLIDVVFTSLDTGYIAGANKDKSVVIKTTDGGNTWKRVFTDSIIGGRIWKLQVLGSNIYGAIEPRYFKDTVCIIHSPDLGNNWKIIPAGSKPSPTSGRIGTQGVGFVTPAKGWVGGYYEGVFETTDSGKTWNYLNFGYDFNRIFVIDSSHVFAGGHMPYKYGSGVYSGVKETKGNSKTSHSALVSPNPATSVVNITLNIKSGTNVLLEVFNIESKQTYRVANCYLEKGKHNFRWDCTNVPAGNYIVWFDNTEIPQAIKLSIIK